MAKRKGVNSRKRYAQKKKKIASGVGKAVPRMVIGMLVAGALVAAIKFGCGQYERIAAALNSTGFFSVRSITVKGNMHVSVKEILERCGVEKTSKIYKVNATAVNATLAGNPWIEKVTCVKKWWGEVVIEIMERSPVALVNAGEVVLVDRQGYILPVESGMSYDLPVLCGAKVKVDGKKRKCIDSALIARTAGFIDAVTAENASLFGTITQLDVSDPQVLRGYSASLSTTIEMAYDADRTQLRNLHYLLDELAQRHEVPECINVQYQNLAFVKVEARTTTDNVHETATD